MASLIAAFQFLTLFPIPTKPSEKKEVFAHSVRYFPLVGVVLALILSIAYELLIVKFEDPAVCLMLVILLFFLTKGLHIDGLSDTFDAILSGQSREKMLVIMKDHNSGALGTAVLVFVLLLKVFLLSEIFEYMKFPALFLALAGSRAGMSLILGLFPYLRGSEGIGFSFTKYLTRVDWMIAVLIGLAVALVSCRFYGLFAFAAGLATILIFAWLVNRKLGGITGDVVGAANEIGEVAMLFWLKVFLV